MKKKPFSGEFLKQVKGNPSILYANRINSQVKIYDSYNLNQSILYLGREYGSRPFAAGIIFISHFTQSPFRSVVLHKFPGTGSQNIKYKIDEDGRIRVWASFTYNSSYISLTGNVINLVPENPPEDAVALT